ncbi:hypothetical protein [Chryseosolibacter indicus]|uniref:Transglutaminase-like domain-containing protein n=1 Tax=Chryseosolibacter indicus TaxID=2782351 RepID=A0ABS5VWK7_9BACT|nr:hypothetical protein [Chryseosolibacter indicus]MBT1705808.1 hypothetical protein [Chryseosolibacter indicus]
MKKLILLLSIVLNTGAIHAQQNQKEYFQAALMELSGMLEGSTPLDFERAVFVTENAYHGNQYNYADFKTTIDIHADIISRLITANDNHDWKKFQNNALGVSVPEPVVKQNYKNGLANWAIYTFITDTTTVNIQNVAFKHLPYEYNTDDPFGTGDWKNTQVLTLLQTQKGNCYALVALFKIFAERFKTEASIVIAPQHIYVQHADPAGNLFNVELATRSFPGTGSIQTLTHTTSEALMNDISMRSLDLKQSVALCLVQLAKTYEHRFKTKDDPFLLQCAETALKHDDKNLNAKLLKSQVYEQRVMKQQMQASEYITLLTELYEAGYRQMPDEMRNIILASIQNSPIAAANNHTPNPYESIGGQTKYVSLSKGVFPEIHSDQRIVRYSNTIFDAEKKEILGFLPPDTVSYEVDPVVFALSVDPLTKAYPELTPYQFASNRPIEAIDLDGLEANDLSMELEPVRSLREQERKKGIIHEESSGAKAIKYGVTGGLGLVMAAPAISLVSAEGVTLLFYRTLGLAYSNPMLAAEGTAAIAGFLYEGADDLCPTCKGDEVAKVFRGAGNKVLDFFGGRVSKYASALNIDPQAEKGFKGTIQDFYGFMKDNNLLGTVDNIIADNPYGYADYLNEASGLLKEGGTITIRGTMGNKFFNQILKGTAAGLDNFDVMKQATKVSDEVKATMTQTGGQPIINDVYEVVLQKKN